MKHYAKGAQVSKLFIRPPDAVVDLRGEWGFRYYRRGCDSDVPLAVLAVSFRPVPRYMFVVVWVKRDNNCSTARHWLERSLGTRYQAPNTKLVANGGDLYEMLFRDSILQAGDITARRPLG